MEGSNIWFDNVVLTKSSKNVEAAHIFIDWLLDAEVAAANTEWIGYSSPNRAAMEIIPAEMRDDPHLQFPLRTSSTAVRRLSTWATP